MGKRFFVKKLCMGEQTFLGKFMGGCIAWGLMIRFMEGEKLMVKRFQRLSQVSFPLIDPDLGIDILIEKLTPQIGD